MPYDASYTGQLRIEPPLNPTEQKALSSFLGSRRIRTVAGPLDSRKLDSTHFDVLDYNRPPEGQPSLWTGLRIANDGEVLEWNGEEKPGDLTAWIRYLIDHLLKPRAAFLDLMYEVGPKDLLRGFTFDHVVNGQLVGTSRGEVWAIRVQDNDVVTTDMVAPVITEEDDE